MDLAYKNHYEQKPHSFQTKFLRIGHSVRHTHCMHTYMHPPALRSLFWRSSTFLFWLQGPQPTKQCNASYYAPSYKHACFRQLKRPLYLREGRSTMWNTGQKGQVFSRQQYDELVQISKEFLIFGCLISKIDTLSITWYIIHISYLCRLGDVKSLVSRYIEGYSFWGI